MSTLRYFAADNADVQAPVLDVTVEAIAPGVAIAVSPPVIDVTVEVPAPGVSADRAVSPPVIDVTIEALAPSVSNSSARRQGAGNVVYLRPVDAQVRPPLMQMRIEAIAPGLVIEEPDYEEELLLVALAA